MSWITENPWPLMMILSGLAALVLLLGEGRIRSLAAVFVALVMCLYFLEARIVTPAELVESRLESLLGSFKAENQPSIDEHIDDGSPKLRETAAQGLKLVALDEAFHLEGLRITVSEDGHSADAELRANGMMTVRQSNSPYHASTRWRTKWMNRDGAWKLSEVHRLNPVTGDEIGILEAQ